MDECRSLLHGIKLSAQAGNQDETPPDKLLVVPWGLTQTAEGPLLCDEGTATILPERQRKARADRVPIDFDHGAAFGAGKGAPRNIAGYGTPKVVAGEGVWLMDIRWTPDGKKYWANYEDLSPGILQQKQSGRVTFLDSVALTPRGMVEGLSLFSAESDDLPNNNPNANHTQQSAPVLMNPDKLKNFLKKCKVSFSETATADELMTLAEAQMEKMGADDNAATMAAPDTAAALKKLEDEITALKSADAARNKGTEDARKADIIRLASAEGKLLPPEEVIKNMTAEDLQKTADAAKAGTVPTNPAAAHNKGAGESAVTLSAEDKEVARIMGIPEEEAKKFHAFGKAQLTE